MLNSCVDVAAFGSFCMVAVIFFRLIWQLDKLEFLDRMKMYEKQICLGEIEQMFPDSFTWKNMKQEIRNGSMLLYWWL